MMQCKLKTFAENSCLALCYLWYGKQSLSLADTMKYLSECMSKGYIADDGFVLNPEGILRLITNKSYKVTWQSVNPGKICIAEFYNGKHTHFVVVDANDTVIYDPLNESYTVRNGKIRSYREIWKA